MDSSALNKLIPQMFDEMRYNLGNKGGDKKDTSENNVASSITTQSLLRELECLDKIIPMIESVDSSLQEVLPSHLAKVNEICKSTNALLDSWINIHSQAGHIHKLMSSTEYLKYASTHLKADQNINARELIESEETEVERLKQEVAKEKQKLNSDLETANNTRSNTPITERMGKTKSRAGTSRGSVTKAPNIPRVNSRLTRPTVSSSRKMFR